MTRYQRLLIAALAFVMCITLNGCAPYFVVPSTEGDFAAEDLPIADNTPPRAPEGDACVSTFYHAQLYYLSLDGSVLAPVQRTIWLSGDWRFTNRLIDELLRAPDTAQADAVAPYGAKLISVETAQELAVVNLHLTEVADLPLLASALALTLNDALGIDRVCLLIDGHAAIWQGLPLGVVHAGETDVASLRAIGGEDALKTADATVAREAALYYPTADGQYLIPETRTLSARSADLGAALVDALSEGASSGHALPGVPHTSDALAQPLKVIVDADGKCVLEVHFHSEVYDALETAHISKWQFLASVALSLTTFIPDIDGVRVDFDGRVVTEVTGPDGVLRFQGGVMRRADFCARVATPVTLYFPGAGDNLIAETRFLPQTDADLPRARLKLLLNGPVTPGSLCAAPLGVDETDILGVRVEDGVALVNLSKRFYRLTQALTAREETLLAYSIVNTLTDMPGVTGVRLYIDGEQADTLAGGIWLRGVLLRNPGLIQTDE